MDRSSLVITDPPAARRYEARLGQQLVGFIDYRHVGDRLMFLHTEVPPAFEGQGIAGALARFVLDAARAHQDRVSIKCPYLLAFVKRHPEYIPSEAGRIASPDDG